MKQKLLSFFLCLMPVMASAQGWPAQYDGVMLQGFYWDSFDDSKWRVLENQADELAEFFSLIWVPQSGKANGSTSMGYDPKYYWNQNSTFGTEAELRSMISAFKAKGLGTIADVVINHRANLSNWVDFPAETYKGVTYQMVSTDICADDDNGAAKKWADANGYQLSKNNDSGEGWDGMRDLDHASQNVQTIIKAYEDYLLNDLGYVGFRYDVAKGFAAKYFALYNSTAKPQFSVGEVWDSNQTIINWINGTKTDGTTTFAEPQSAAFDFQFRYQVRDAINNNNWSTVAGSNCLIKNNAYKRYAVTFLENHDTEKRANANQDPIKRDTVAANAYLLAMPGTPCVFFKHWQAYKREIKKMIAVRKFMGITNQSEYMAYGQSAACTSLCVTGSRGDLIVSVGPNASSYTRDGFKVLLAGNKYQYLIPATIDTKEIEATFKHIDETTTEPEPVGVTIPDFAVIQTGTYAYFEKPASWSSTINVWAWNSKKNNVNAYANASWPGTVSQKDISVAGVNPETNLTVYLWKYSGTETPDMVIFNDGSHQTSDLNFQSGGYYTQDGLVGNAITAIAPAIADSRQSADNAWYTINGTRIDTPSAKGVYIRNGKKYVVK